VQRAANGALKQYVMRFKPAALVNGTNAIQGNRTLGSSQIEIGSSPEIVVNEAFRYNKINVAMCKMGDKFLVNFPVESKQIKSRMGRSSSLDMLGELSWIMDSAAVFRTSCTTSAGIIR
jgi:hypothetical protein